MGLDEGPRQNISSMRANYERAFFSKISINFQSNINIIQCCQNHWRFKSYVILILILIILKFCDFDFQGSSTNETGNWFPQ